VVVLFERPGDAVALSEPLVPQLASWDKAGSPGQQRLADWLHHLDGHLRPVSTEPGPFAVELTVGLPDDLPLDSGGRDLDNYLLPVAQRIGANRIVAAFGRKTRGRSSFAISSARPTVDRVDAAFTTTMTGSYDSAAWRQSLRDQLVAAGVQPTPAGPVRFTAAITTGRTHTWSNLWKPLIDSLGPMLGEHPSRGPHDDRIVDLGLHHHVEPDLDHRVTIHLWWSTTAVA
jgi:hypothetical protein